ncbi:MAG: hypothetical protein M1830_001643 [Pleopsidium flavum]|nr:MAG: hypothetical protein M1830_001643 [Pleopsidium flavum]
MPLELHEVTSASEFPEIMACYWAASRNPRSKFTPLFAPVLDSGPTSSDDALKGFMARSWFAHSLDPSSHWIKVVDPDQDNKVIAAAKWMIYPKDPFAKGIPPTPSAFWWPDGEGRRYVNMVFENITKLRVRRQPHALLHGSMTHPDHRRRGAGNLLMDWGTRKADELGLESFIEASDMGRWLYVHHEFRIMGEGDIQPYISEEEKSEEWKRYEEMMSPLKFAIMWRPVKGKWESAGRESVAGSRLGE